MIENKLKESFFIEQAMVIGENEKFASALISPNFEYLHDWCSQHKIFFRTCTQAGVTIQKNGVSKKGF